MPVLISDEDYKEYIVLQHNALHQQKLRSAAGMDTLKNDIDIPMVGLVALFALLGCEPLWSCCGFDYAGQPMHKTHEYGDSYIFLRETERTQEVVAKLIELGIVTDGNSETDEWSTRKDRGRVLLICDFDWFHEKSKYPWSMKSCIHYPELALIKIDKLERALLVNFMEQLQDEVTLKDTNETSKTRLRNWQYPPLKDWVIRKEEIFGK